MGVCDLRTGLCTTENDEAEVEILTGQGTPAARITYATDPICSHCWAMEPGWRKLLYHYGSALEVRHLYGGLLPRWEGFADAANAIAKPADVAPHWAEVAEHFGQPIDPSVWLKDPLASSYPPSEAVLVARLMEPGQEERYLRRIREAVFLEGRNIARREVLVEAARDVGLDPDRFAALYDAGAGKGPFEQDRREVRTLPVRGFPTLIIQGEQGSGLILRGTQPYARLEQALLQVTGLPRVERTPSTEEALAAYGSGTLREFAELLEMEPQAAVTALTAEGASSNGHLWRR